MPKESDKFTFVWKISNFRYGFRVADCIRSPTFSVKSFHGTKWCLELRMNDKNFISVSLKRECEDAGPTIIDIFFALILNNNIVSSAVVAFTNGFSSSSPNKAVSRIADSFTLNFCTVKCVMLLEENKSSFTAHSFLPHFLTTEEFTQKFLDHISSPSETEVLNVCKKLFTQPFECISLSQFIIEKSTFTWIIDDFIFSSNKDRRVLTMMSCTNIPVLFLNLYTSVKDDIQVLLLDISIIREEVNTDFMLACKINLLDSEEEIVDSAEDYHLFKTGHSKVWHYGHQFKWNNIRNRVEQSSSTVIILSCEITFSEGEMQSQILQTTVANYASSITTENTSSVGVLKEMERLYKEKKLCDVTLKTGDKTFDAHKVVLCAMSPVFSAMFESGMKEADTNVVSVEDLDSDTVELMLSFLYSETIAKQDFASASKLYSAADKYQILPLKKLCRNFFKNDLDSNTVCSVLSLADAHEDKVMKQFAVEFICNYKEIILLSSKWKEFSEQNVTLAMKILQEICIKSPY